MPVPGLGPIAFALTLPGTVELGVLSVASRLPAPLPARTHRSVGRVVVVVPAHDEEGGIGTTIASLRACHAPSDGFDVLVVADNCTDQTAARARAAGASVIERRDPNRRGKGYALELGFARAFEDARVGAVLVVDADTSVEPNFVIAMHDAFTCGADSAQCRYAISPSSTPDAAADLARLAFRGFCVVRPKGRERLGVSVGILGNGFGLTREVLQRVPYTARSVVEDLEYHLMLVEAGFRVRFVETTEVQAAAPSSALGQEQQRDRWEGGRYRMIKEHAPRLAAQCLRGELRSVEPLLELCLLPLGTHVGLLGLALASLSPLGVAAGAIGLATVGLHVGIASNGASREELAALAGAPRYVANKFLSLPRRLLAARGDQAWVRTDRAATREPNEEKAK